MTQHPSHQEMEVDWASLTKKRHRHSQWTRASPGHHPPSQPAGQERSGQHTHTEVPSGLQTLSYFIWNPFQKCPPSGQSIHLMTLSSGS